MKKMMMTEIIVTMITVIMKKPIKLLQCKRGEEEVVATKVV